ncbi:hypothetical protein F5I97DRAFT_1974631 [Phlebopus sp. FC_14]|nr:hypothetical protein F5I97DRAFT_1974631 [Phlebopus sp. FC_14]
MSAFAAKARLGLDIIIVGGGITGLAAAFRLSHAGHKVRVLEKTRHGQKDCGVRVPPNLTKILDEWGLGEQLGRRGTPTTGSQCYSLEAGNLVGYLVWQEAVIEEIGANYTLMHYQDLHAILLSAALDAGVQILYDTAVTQVSSNPARVEIASGETFAADLIIGADGTHSIIREAIEGGENIIQSDEVRFSVYVATMSRERLRQDPELDAFTTVELGGPQYPIWMGTGCHAVGFAVRGGSQYTIHVFWPDRLIDGDSVCKEWDSVIPRDKLRISGDSKLQRLLDLCPTLQRRRYVPRESALDWIDESGRIVLIGQAAHPSLHCITHSESLQVEDAEVLGWLLSRLHSWEQLPHLLEGFQEIRQERCRVVHEKEYTGFQLVWLPPGAERDARDESLRAMMVSGLQGWNEEKMRWQWEEIGGVLGYNAREAAQDWWVNWGMLRERSKVCGSTKAIFTPIEASIPHGTQW